MPRKKGIVKDVAPDLHEPRIDPAPRSPYRSRMSMKLTQENTGDANRIRRYDTGSVTVNETLLTRTLLLMPEWMDEHWGPESATELTDAHVDSMIAHDPELIIIGTGRHQYFPDRTIMARAIQAGVGIEVMTTEAACRTYNVLASEQRRVLAALFMIEPET